MTAPVGVDPKGLFQKRESLRVAFGNMARSDTLQEAVSAALAEYAALLPSAENLAGVNQFIGILLNLSEIRPVRSTGQIDRRLVPPEKLSEIESDFKESKKG